MNESQQKVKQFMDSQIDQLESGLENLKENKDQPVDIGNLYNGMLRNSVSFEITHLQKLEQELLDVLK